MSRSVNRTEKELETLGKYLKGDISHDNGIHILKVNNVLGQGQIRCVSFNGFMTSVEIDVLLNRNILLTLGSKESEMLYFMYALEGSCSHKFDNSVEFIDLDSLRPMVVVSGEKVASQLLIRENERLHMNLIRVDRDRFADSFKDGLECLGAKLKELLEAFDGHDKRYHLGRHNLKIGEHLKALENNTRNNDVSSILQFKGISNLILSEQIVQYYRELRSMGQVTTLSRKELQAIEELSDFIKNYPEIQHSIKSLCKKGGISSAKLQEGFKLMHQMTVSNFIRNVRLEKAERLIRTSELNVSEVVYTIGLTSRSYFCKIFKAKYHCSPKAYRKKANVITMQ